VRTAEIRYDATREANRYAGNVQSRFEVDHAFRVGGKVARRMVDVGQFVHEGDVLAVLDDSDYRLAEEAARQQWTVAVAQARQAESDRKRLGSLKADGSVSVADDEHAHSGAQTAQASEEAQARQLELARNRVKYTVLRASRSGVVTAVRFEVGQVVAEGQPGSPSPTRHAGDRGRRAGRSADDVQEGALQGSLASAPDERFEVALRELSPQAAAQTRTYRARLKPVTARPLPLGATATL
jgi:multidrug efflux pump subunit AcrA (membrane-fusion protein)